MGQRGRKLLRPFRVLWSGIAVATGRRPYRDVTYNLNDSEDVTYNLNDNRDVSKDFDNRGGRRKEDEIVLEFFVISKNIAIFVEEVVSNEENLVSHTML